MVRVLAKRLENTNASAPPTATFASFPVNAQSLMLMARSLTALVLAALPNSRKNNAPPLDLALFDANVLCTMLKTTTVGVCELFGGDRIFAHDNCTNVAPPIGAMLSTNKERSIRDVMPFWPTPATVRKARLIAPPSYTAVLLTKLPPISNRTLAEVEHSTSSDTAPP